MLHSYYVEYIFLFQAWFPGLFSTDKIKYLKLPHLIQHLYIILTQVTHILMVCIYIIFLYTLSFLCVYFLSLFSTLSCAFLYYTSLVSIANDFSNVIDVELDCLPSWSLTRA